MFRILFSLLVVLLFCFPVHAEKKEIVGNLSLSDLLIQPRFLSIEGGDSEFDLDKSYFFFSWEMSHDLSIHFGVGKRDLMNKNYRLPGNNANSGEDEDLAFFEAYGEYNSGFGIFRGGIIPTYFGWEGGRRESEWLFPMTLFYDASDVTGEDSQNLGLRDYGGSYYTSWRYFYTQITVHNGENGDDQDGKLWHSARWGWKNPSGIEISFSAAGGKYQQGNFPEIYKYKYGNAFVSFEFQELLLLVEGYYGEENKESDSSYAKKYWDIHTDFSHPLSSKLAGLVRYEIYEPDSMVENDRIQRFIVGLSLSNEEKTSQLFLWGIKNKEQVDELNNDQLQLVWKVRSLSFF